MKQQKTFPVNFSRKLFPYEYIRLIFSVLILIFFTSVRLTAQPDCSTQDIKITQNWQTCEVCFTFIPAEGAQVDDWIWTVYNPYSDVCETSNAEQFCYRSCFTGNFEIGVTATYDNLTYTCKTYKYFSPICAESPCNPAGPPVNSPPRVSIQLMETACQGPYYAVETECSCPGYEYTVYYYEPNDLSLPCFEEPSHLVSKTMGPCECIDIFTSSQHDVIVTATLAATCCNAELSYCRIFPYDPYNMDICYASPSGCNVCPPISWNILNIGGCNFNLVGAENDSEEKVIENEDLHFLPINNSSKKPQKITIYDMTGHEIYNMGNVNIGLSRPDEISKQLYRHIGRGMHIIRISYSDGTYKVKVVMNVKE